VKALDQDGREIARGTAQAQDEWMTEEFVPFSLNLSFEMPSAGKGMLILEKANPSGLPENAAALEVPVYFSNALKFIR
jgi:hypothetical protein